MEPEQLSELIIENNKRKSALEALRNEGRQALLKELKEEVEKIRLENDDTTGQTHSILDLVLRLITSKMKE